SKQSCEARERDLFESWVMHSICISKSTLEGLRTETGYRNATLSGTDFNRMWKQWKSIRATGIRIKGE
ncbi:ead/Ea22-like family protein, partial [Escherichia coli]